MNCAFDKEKLSGYYDGELDAAEKAEVERHIASCSECLRELGELKSAALLVKELPRLRAPRSIAEGVKREIQAAGKVHRFAAVRKNLMWAAAVAAALLVAVNVAYFSKNSADKLEAPVAAQSRPSSAIADSAMPRTPAPRNAAEELRRFDESGERRAQDRAADQKPAAAENELRKNLSEGKAEAFGRAERGEKDAPKPAPFAETAKAEPARERTLAAAPPPGAPAPKPEAAAPVVAPKAEPRPLPAPAEKPAEAKRDAEGLARSDADLKAKKSGAPEAGVDAPAHFTLASTQMAKSRQQVEATLLKLGVAFPAASQPVRGGAGKAPATAPENTYTLEMTDSQIAKLREEIAKQSYSRFHAAAPGDLVLAQYGDAGLYKSREKAAGVASAGAAAPPPAPAKKPKDDAKEVEDPQAGAKPAADKSVADKLDKAGEPRRKVVLHLLEVLAFPDPQPAGDPVKK